MFLLVLFAVFELIKCGISLRRDVYLHATRKSVMTQKRRQKKSKKTKKSQSDLSDSGTFDGSTAPPSYTAQGGSPGDLESDRALSPPVTGHPVTGQPVTGQPVTGQPVTGQPVTGQQITGQPVTGHPVTGQPVTSQPGTSYQSFTYDFQTQFIPDYLPVNVPQLNYAPSISSHVS